MQQETKRQKQVAGLIKEELSVIFQRLGLSMVDGGMISISSVKITPDLFEARVYISLFQIKDPVATMKNIEERSWEIKKELVSRVKHQLRSMPQLSFFKDDTLDYVYKMEEVFKKINDGGKESGSLGVGSRESGVGSQESGVGSRELGVGSRFSNLDKSNPNHYF